MPPIHTTYKIIVISKIINVKNIVFMRVRSCLKYVNKDIF